MTMIQPIFGDSRIDAPFIYLAIKSASICLSFGVQYLEKNKNIDLYIEVLEFGRTTNFCL